MRTFNLFLIALMSLCLENLAIGAGTGGSGGSPPSILLPSTQFTQMSLGILRGDDILIRSQGIDRKFHPTGIDTINGTITILSPEDGSVVLLQDFDKKNGKTSTSLNLTQKTKSKMAPAKKILSGTIPENTEVMTIPSESGDDQESASDTGGGGSSLPSTEDGGVIGSGGSPPK